MDRVVMFVYNDCTTDSRVLREAATLAASGRAVTVMARPRDMLHGIGDTERRDGFDIVRVAVPGAWRRVWTALFHPWRSEGILRWLLLPWSAVRAPFHLLARRRRRDGSLGSLDWLAVWRLATMGWARDAARSAPPGDVFHGHDLHGLIAAARAQAEQGGALVYDSHEIFLESGTYVHRPRWARALLARMERGLVRRAAALVTVNDAVGAELVRRLHPRRLVVVHNCPPRWDRPDPLPDLLRHGAGIPPDVPLLLYHGAFSRHRGLEQLAEASLEPGLERCHVVYLGYGGYRSAVDALVADPRFGGRLHVLDAVDPSVLLEWVAGADVEVIAGQHSTLNHYLSAPNKLFESLAAGVPVVIMDFPHVRRIVMDDPDGPLGAMCDPADPASIAAGVRSILELSPADRQGLAERCRRAAHDRWNWETESARLVGLYDDLAAAGRAMAR
jgi:glycosyltransferase involved in cell wall biosynthesis